MNLFELFIKIGLKDEASKEAEKLADKLGNGLKTAAKVGAAAVGAATAGVVALTKQAVESFAEYEQLVGGVETIFGAGGRTLEEYAKMQGKTVKAVEKEYESLMNSQETVFKNASKAYETAGLSANNYMETVTSFSESLIQSLGGDTEKAASYADRAITDMSDNANKMGTDIKMIQNAYQGFAKQNYTINNLMSAA